MTEHVLKIKELLKNSGFLLESKKMSAVCFCGREKKHEKMSVGNAEK